ncbi:hypothetical protein MFLAVUS_002764 [Mucor flavus]|uniref:Copper-fist domain-containing protein n=1 Tax=Mucor flavus TaxID=439312 RepID=A0ABP9YR80_9FUNG
MYINGLKYACSTCIKGHRSSHCSHVDRPLFEIRKKGRPVTQCTFCRDLRKTKQVHIKCACSDKKVNTAAEKPILIYRNSEDKCKEIVGVNKHGQQCTCPNNTPTTTTQSPKTTYLLKSNVTQDSPTQMSVTQDSSSLLAPLCPTAPSLVKEEQLSYSWALITSPSANQIDLPVEPCASTNLFTDMMMDDDATESNSNLQHLGFIFHKPTSTQRFLDGQPRIRRRRSTNQKRTIAANSATVTPTNYSTPTRLPINALVNLTIDTLNDYSLSTPPSSAVSPHRMSSSSSTAASCSAPTTAAAMSNDPMDIQFDYLTEQLEILSSSSSSNNNHGFIGDLANADELTAILNNVLQKEDDDDVSLPSVSSSSYSTHLPVTCSSSSTTTTTTATNTKAMSAPVIPTLSSTSSHCGSFVPRSKCCKPMGALGGESVVITITPLTNTSSGTSNNNNNSMLMMLEDDQTQQKTTTRIVTCYCGNQCTCPGCLVHPGNFFLGTDPYSGLMMNPSSSASSSCYGSDEEDLSSIYSKIRDQMMTEETREAFSLFDKDNRDASELGFHHEVRGLPLL